MIKMLKPHMVFHLANAYFLFSRCHSSAVIMETFFHVDGSTVKKRGGICSDGEKAGIKSAEISIILCGFCSCENGVGFRVR